RSAEVAAGLAHNAARTKPSVSTCRITHSPVRVLENSWVDIVEKMGQGAVAEVQERSVVHRETLGAMQHDEPMDLGPDEHRPFDRVSRVEPRLLLRLPDA